MSAERSTPPMPQTMANSSSRLEAVLKMSPDGIVLTDLGLNIIFASNTAGSVLGGVNPEELIGLSLMGLVHPDDRKRAVDNFERAMAGDDTGPATYRIKVGLAPTPTTCEVHGEMLLDPETEAPLEWLFIFRDTTKQARALEQARSTQELFYEAFELGPLLMSITTVEEGKYLFVNENFTKVSGYTKEEALGKTSTELAIVRPEDRDMMRHLLQSRGRIDGLGLLLRRKDGQALHCVYFGEIISVNGEKRLLSVVEDITVRRRAQLEKEKVQRQLIQLQKLQSVGHLAGGIAQDFEGIMSRVLHETNSMESRLDAGESVDAPLEEIRQAALRGQNITQQLRAFSMGQRMEFRAVDLQLLLASSRWMLDQIVASDIRLRLPTANPVPLVKGDPVHLEQLLVHLTMNARDAMPEGGTLTFSTRSLELTDEFCKLHPGATAGPHVLLVLEDTGRGIQPKHMNHIFEPLFTTQAEQGRPGMGLSIVHGIVQQHCGYVEVHSVPSAGTRVEVYLPTIESKDVIAVAPSSIVEVPKGEETVLVVDDDEAILTIAARILNRLGYDAHSTSSAEEALSKVADGLRPALLISDLALPTGTGITLWKELQKTLPDLQALFTSGYDDRKAIKTPPPDGLLILDKPYTPRELAVKVRFLLDGEG